MKLIKLCIFTILFSLWSPVYSATQSHTLTFNESDFSYDIDETGKLIITSNLLFSYPVEEAPCLPLIGKQLVIPSGSQYNSHECRINKRLIKTDIELAVRPEVVPTDLAVDKLQPQQLSYPKMIFPEDTCRYICTSKWEEMTILHFLASPYVYDAASQELYFVDSIELNIELNDSASSAFFSGKNRDVAFIQTLVSNPEEINHETLASLPATQTTQNCVDYVIVTNEALKESFQPLCNWKNQKGIASTIVTIEEIRQKYSGTDDQIKIKRYLYELYLNHGLKYALLGGDNTVIPVRGCYVSFGGYTDSTIPADIYYATFDDNFDWDGNQNGIYGEQEDQINFSQSIFVTRLPIRSTTDANTIVDRIISYEKTPLVEPNILMAGVQLYYNKDGQSDAEYEGNLMYERYIQPYWDGARYRFYDTGTDFDGDASYDVTGNHITDQFNKGYGFFQMQTHGAQTTWATETGLYFHDMHFKNLNNPNHTIITTTACHSNSFDYARDPCLSELFIRKQDTGIIAFLGSSRQGWTNVEPSKYGTLGTSLQYDGQFYKYLLSDEIVEKNFGRIVAAMKESMISSAYAGPQRWLMFSLNPMGDPEMPIFIHKPVSFPSPFIKINNGTLTYNTSLLNARFCISTPTEDGITIFKKVDGIDQLSIDGLPSDFILTSTAQHYIPDIYTVKIFQDEVIETDGIYERNLIHVGSASSDAREVRFKSGNTVLKGDEIILFPGTVIEKGVTVSIQ